jgi:hypothetical protein
MESKNATKHEFLVADMQKWWDGLKHVINTHGLPVDKKICDKCGGVLGRFDDYKKHYDYSCTGNSPEIRAIIDAQSVLHAKFKQWFEAKFVNLEMTDVHYLLFVGGYSLGMRDCGAKWLGDVDAVHASPYATRENVPATEKED